jgi:hypothetical protein
MTSSGAVIANDWWIPTSDGHIVLPEYIAFHGSLSLMAVWKLLRITESI